MYYEEALKYIENIQPLGFQLGLERIKRLLDRLGNPHHGLKCVHVAGTNGKGSACSMLRHILTHAGYKTGLYTSPHLSSYNERMEIDGIAIANEEFADIAEIVAKSSQAMVQAGEGQPTVFEFLTAMAFYYFYRQQVDILILEVGLGGRFDATNVITNPLVCLIMSISMDHMEYLGDHLDKIAYEKAGIIKENCPVVLYSQTPVVYNVISGICEEKHAPLYETNVVRTDIRIQTLTKTVFFADSPYFHYPNVSLPLLGSFQVENCKSVLLACYLLQKQGLSKLSHTVVLEGLSKTNWKGRMEILGNNPTVIIDGAHNADGIQALAASMLNYFPNKKITLILGVLGDKEYEKMSEILLPLVDSIVLTEPASNRKLSLAALERTLLPYGNTLLKEEKIKNAYETALKITEKSGVILAAGSLYMIGEIREYIVDKNNMGGKKHD